MAEYSTNWLHSGSELAYFYRRNRIYDYIRQKINKGENPDVAVNELESFRVLQNWTLTALQGRIRSTLCRDDKNVELNTSSPAKSLYSLLNNPSLSDTGTGSTGNAQKPDAHWECKNGLLPDESADIELRLEPSLDEDGYSLFPELL